MTDIEILESANLEEENETDEDDGIKIFDESVVKVLLRLELHWTRCKTYIFTKKKVIACKIFYNDLNHCSH